MAARPPRARRRRWTLVTGIAVVLLVAAGLAMQRAAPWSSDLAVATATPAPRPQARGQVRPVAQARVGTLSGGVVTSISVEVGDSVGEQQEIARVRGATAAEVLTAPIRGTITGIPVHAGDTIPPGTIVATVGDLTRLQVETTDVDEFLIARVRPGQSVTLTIEALERQVAGRVRTVALEPATTSAGDQHYPVTIELAEVLPDLRPGMTVRVLVPD